MGLTWRVGGGAAADSIWSIGRSIRTTTPLTPPHTYNTDFTKPTERAGYLLNLTKNGVEPLEILSSAMNSRGWKARGAYIHVCMYVCVCTCRHTDHIDHGTHCDPNDPIHGRRSCSTPRSSTASWRRTRCWRHLTASRSSRRAGAGSARRRWVGRGSAVLGALMIRSDRS